MLSCCYGNHLRLLPLRSKILIPKVFGESGTFSVCKVKRTEHVVMAEGIRRTRSVQLKYLATLHQIGKPLEEPIIGRHFKLPERPRPAEHPVFDMSLLYIPIYCHLVLHPPQEIVRPPTPELITRARMEKTLNNWLD